jgi:predicted ribosomally synthesized peptide with SipW-like signal peptide
MNKKLSQILILAVAAIALVVTSVLGTMAFLTSSAAVANTFTVGEVFIHMYESAVKDNGEIDSNVPYKNDMKPSAGNVYNLMPGHSYVKDPTIYVDAKSQSSYLFLKVRNDIRSIEEGIIQFESIVFL